MRRMINLISTIIFFLYVTLIVSLGIHGLKGNPTESNLNNDEWKEDGPLELSPERGRFGLTFSLVENNSFFYSLPVARFATPDTGYKDARFVSLFAPAVSFLLLPGYILGKQFGISQVGSFAIIGLFAILNSFLIKLIARQLGANSLASSLAALIFLFATPAFAYAVSLYQHHVTVFLILVCLYSLIKDKGVLPLILVWILIGFSISIDYPNFFLFFPLGIYSLARIFLIQKTKEGLRINIKVLGILSLLVFVLPISFFLWTNYSSYGNSLQLGGTMLRVRDFDENGKPVFSRAAGQRGLTLEAESEEKTATRFFKTRNILNGLYIHVFSPDRGIIFYTPVLFFAIPGIWFLYRRHPSITALLLAVSAVDVLLYSMWGDPWGGWAFGSRYLIPLYAILAIFLAATLTEFRNNLALLSLFFVILFYSVSVNTLGALTTNKLPPKGEATALEKISGRKEEYTYKRNWDFLSSNKSKSFVWQTFVKNTLSAIDYYYLVSGSIILVMAGQTAFIFIKSKQK